MLEQDQVTNSTTAGNEQSSTAVADSSSTGTTGQTAAPAGPQGTTGAAGAGDKAGEKKDERPATSLEAVKKVMADDRTVAEKKAGGATTTTAQGADKTGGQQATGTESKEGGQHGGKDTGRLTDEEFKALPPKAQTRFNQLFREARTAETQMKQLTPKAQAYDELRGWTEKQGVNQEEFGFWLEVLGNCKHDPVKAYEMLQPTLKALRAHVGEELPEDLAADAAAGTISKERAQELARERAERSRLEAEGRRRVQTDERTRQSSAAQALTATVTKAIEGYEGQWKGTDPDYTKKSQRVWERMVTIMQTEGAPRTAEAGVELIKRARVDVEKWMSTFVAAPRAKDPLPAGGSNAGARPQPKTSLDAARLAVGA